MKARTIRNIYDIPAYTEGIYDDFDRDDYKYGFKPDGSETVWMVEVGVDIELVDVPEHLYNRHDDIVSACYWADRIMNLHFPVYVIRNDGGYAITYTDDGEDVQVAERSPQYGWMFLEERSNRKLGATSGETWNLQFSELEEQSWQEMSDEDRDILETSMGYVSEKMDHEQHYHLCSDDDTRHILEDMLFDVVFPGYGATNCIVHYLPDSGEWNEIWVTDDSRWWELGTGYRRLK